MWHLITTLSAERVRQVIYSLRSGLSYLLAASGLLLLMVGILLYVFIAPRVERNTSSSQKRMED